MIRFPNRNFHFSVSVGAILSLGTAFTLDPLQSAIIVIAANLIVDVCNRLKPIQLVVNSANLGLATFLAGSVYWAIADSAKSPIDSTTALVATIVASTVYTVANLGMLSVIVAPVVGDIGIHFKPDRLVRRSLERCSPVRSRRLCCYCCSATVCCTCMSCSRSLLGSPRFYSSAALGCTEFRRWWQVHSSRSTAPTPG